MLEGAKRASRASYTMGSKVRDGGLFLIPGTDAGGASNLEGDVVFNVAGQPGLGLTFLSDYQLEAEMSLSVAVVEYTDHNYMLTVSASGGGGGPETTIETLCPDRHGLTLSPSGGVLSFYNRVECTYANGYTDPLENLVCGSANLLSKTSALEASFGQPGGRGGEGEAGRREGQPCFNRGVDKLRQRTVNWPTDPTEDPEQSFRVYRSRIPRFPFRLLTPWQAPRLAGTLGRDLDYPKAGLIPPDTNFRVLLRRETRVPDIMLLFPLKQRAELCCGEKPTLDNELREWRRFKVVKKSADGKTEKVHYYEVVSLKPRLRKLSLVVKKLHFCADPWQTGAWPTQVHSVYRTLAVELSKATTQVLGGGGAGHQGYFSSFALAVCFLFLIF